MMLVLGLEVLGFGLGLDRCRLVNVTGVYAILLLAGR